MKIVLWILLVILILIGLYILFLGICALLVDPKKDYEHFSPFYFRVLNSATACSFVLARLRISTSGMEKVPWDQRSSHGMCSEGTMWHSSRRCRISRFSFSAG